MRRNFGRVFGAALAAWGLGLGASAPVRAQAEPGSPCILFLSGRVEEKEFGNPNKYRLRSFLPDERLQRKLKEWGCTWAADFFSTGMTWEDFTKFNAVVMLDFPNVERHRSATDGIRRVEGLLRRYVEAGGGLFLTGHIEASQWGLERNTEELNRFLAPWGGQVLLEQVDEQDPVLRQVRPHRYGISGLAWTDNVVAHALTKGVTGFLYPSDYGAMCYYTHPVRVSGDWQVLLKASATARSVTARIGAEDWRKSKRPGAIAGEPPLLAVREAGKGRVVLWPMIPTATIIDGYHQFWGHGLTMVSRDRQHPSEGETLIMNLLRWLVAPSRGQFGGYVKRPPPPEKELGLYRINWNRVKPSGAQFPSIHKGLIGMRSSLSTGTASPEAMIRAAKEAGYDFAAFGEDLGELTEAELSSLTALCAGSCEESFQAFAGVIYRDASGNAWQVFGNSLHWPRDDWWHDKAAGTIQKNNLVFRGYQFIPLIMVHPNRNPEDPWFQGNFKGLALYTYEGGELVDEATQVYRELQSSDFKLFPAAIHRVGSVEEVKQAAQADMPQTYVPWYELSDVISGCSGNVPRYQGNYVHHWPQFVSSGPLVEAFRVINFGTSDLAIPDNDRFRMHVRLTSDRGLREVKILDGLGLWRRFLLDGVKEWEQLFDGFHDRNRHFMIVATDVAGGTAWSADHGTSVQEINVPRCTDNLNTYTSGKFKAQNVFPVRGLENYFGHRAGDVNSFPRIPGVDETKRFAIQQRLEQVSRFGYVRTDLLHHCYPPTATPNWNLNDLPEVAKPQTALKGQVTTTVFTPWADGTSVHLVQGDFEILRDLDVPRGIVGLYQVSWINEAETFVASRRDRSFETVCLKPRRTSWRTSTEAVEYVANIGAFTGSRAFVPLGGPPMEVYGLRQGIGEKATFGFLGRQAIPEKKLGAGDTLSYEYLAVWTAMRDKSDNSFIEDLCAQMGLRGETAYSVKPTRGTVLSARFVLSLKAQDYGFAGAITQAQLPLLLPAFVEGLNARWPAGVWYKGKHTFAVPTWTMDAVHNRYSRRATVKHEDRLVRFGVVDGRGMLQIDTEIGDKDVYIGNLLVCDNPDVFLELEEWRKGRTKIVANNPTDKEASVTIRPGPGFDLMGAFRIEATIPAGCLSVLTPAGQPR